MLPKDRVSLLQLARRKGFRYEVRTNGHIKITNPHTGKFAIHSGTGSDWRGELNFRNDLKNIGLTIDEEACVPKDPLPEPKLVVDKSAPPEDDRRDFLMAPAKKRRSRPHGELSKAILAVLDKLGNRASGYAADDIYAQVTAKVAGELHRNDVVMSMANMAASGKLIRISTGRYRIPDGSATPVVEAPITRSQFVQPIDMNMDRDYMTLSRALDMLQELEVVVRKHQEIAKVFANLKGMMNVLAPKEEPKGE